MASYNIDPVYLVLFCLVFGSSFQLASCSFFGLIESVKCYFSVCCDDTWIIKNFEGTVQTCLSGHMSIMTTCLNDQLQSTTLAFFIYLIYLHNNVHPTRMSQPIFHSGLMLRPSSWPVIAIISRRQLAPPISCQIVTPVLLDHKRSLLYIALDHIAIKNGQSDSYARYSSQVSCYWLPPLHARLTLVL